MKIVDKYNISQIIDTSIYTLISTRASEMSFYLLLAFFPFLIFTINIVGYIPIIHINKSIVFLENIMPQSTVIFILELIDYAIENRSISFLIMSFYMTLWTSSRSIRAFIRNSNKSYKVKETRSFIKISITSFLFTITLLMLIFLSIIFLVYGKKIGHILFNLIGLDKVFMYIWNIVRYTVGIGSIILILISLYRYAPNKKLRIKEAMPGAVIATFSWILISSFYSYYVNNFSNYEVIYGSIAGIIVLITWIYLSSYTLFIGLEVNTRLYFKKNKNKLTNQS